MTRYEKNYKIIKEAAKNKEIFDVAIEILEILSRHNFEVGVMFIFECFAFSFSKDGKVGSFCICANDKKCAFIWMDKYLYSFHKKFKYDKEIFIKCLKG